MSKKIAITFCGGVEEVTGANYLLELSDGDVTHRMLVDCGLTQGSASMEEKNRRPFSYDPKTIDLLLITHAHIDHIGRVPKLVHDGFHGRIVSTPETKELAEPMLLDALKIADEEARRKGILALYEKADLERSLELWDGLSYGTSRELAPGVFVTPRDAGHVLGSAMFEFALDGAIYGDGEGKHQPVRLVFTGDLGNSPSPLLRDTETIRGAHYLVMESVYGDRNHESVEDRRELLKDVVLKTVKKNGTLLVPIFSLEKTQVLLYELKQLVSSEEIPFVPVYLDSPLAVTITEIYRHSSHLFNDEAKKALQKYGDILNFPKLKFTPTRMESQRIADSPNPKVILAGSGMSMGGRIREHEKNYLQDSRNTILFVGYQSAGTLGRQIEEGVKKVEIDGESIVVRAEVVNILGYSSHKDRDHLLDFVEQSVDTLKQVFVVMGEPKSALFLCQRIKDYLGVEALHPEEGERVELH